MHAGGGSFGPERQRHVGNGDGYVIIEKIEKPGFLFYYTGALQHYTIPKTAVYTFAAVGAKGGNCDGCKRDTCEYCCDAFKYKDWCYACDPQYHEGGYGALAKGKFLLHEGDKLEMIVGGKGQDCKTLPRSSIDKKPDGVDRDYLEARTGAGGGGATSVRVKYGGKGDPELLLIAGGGGGSGFFYDGEDGELGPDGGFSWGGRNGGGGGLGPYQYPDPDPEYGPQFGGAGGGGVHGNGASRDAWYSDRSDYHLFAKSQAIYDNRPEERWSTWAEGGFSFLIGSQGGYVDMYEYRNTVNTRTRTESGSAGGYGRGGQGGAGE